MAEGIWQIHAEPAVPTVIRTAGSAFLYFQLKDFSAASLAKYDIIVSAQGQRTHSGLDNRDLFVGQFKITVQILVCPLLLEVHHRNKHEIGFGYVGRGISHSHHEPRELAGHKISKVDSFQLRIKETDIQIGECVHRSRPENLRCGYGTVSLFRTDTNFAVLGDKDRNLYFILTDQVVIFGHNGWTYKAD